MDPFSSEGELLNLHNSFHQGQYTSVISESTAGLSPTNQTAAKVYILRARIQTGEAAAVIQELSDATEPDLKAVKAFAEYTLNANAAEMEQLVAAEAENATVQVLGATVLHLEGRSEEALALLGKHQGNLEALALIVQLRLSQNRTDLALKEVQSAKKWAQDSLLVNLAESWVGLRIGGDKYQQSYYVYEELAQAPISSSAQTLVGQAVAELHLGRLEEAEVALQQALEKNPTHAEALANSIVLATLAGKDSGDYLKTLEGVAPNHIFLEDLKSKSDMFDKAAAKYSPKVGA
ncbi:coatomer epsilon subunit-domain-containing protein [Sphaerosporella brunnea]|uniref:Coatomer subunit epsilon n=1 Tax=Sphaerosporella brunnea TaxID=1250544 RepID=A0A5J5ET67_9PEZI|nr:coatomer epsilon subunit-domain-containing protein [Sphaerosporella brunnea]